MDKSLANPDAFQQGNSLEAIYALNIGDFVLEHFISDDLRQKIHDRLGQEPDKLKRQLAELIDIYSVDKTLGILGGLSAPDLGPAGPTYDAIAATLCDMFQADACHLFQKGTIGMTSAEASSQKLCLLGTSLVPKPADLQAVQIPTEGQDVLLDAYLAQTVVQRAPHGKDRLNWHPISALQQEKTQSFLAAPLMDGRRRLGVLVFDSYTSREFSPELVALADITAKTFVTASRLHHLLGLAAGELTAAKTSQDELVNLRAQITESIADLGVYQQEFVENLAHAIDARQDFTRGHSKRVANIARTLTDAMGLNEKTVDLVYYAGLLGTLGKINISEAVLSKKGQLDQDERAAFLNHPNVSVAFLQRINFLSEVLPYLQAYQERWDGSGGPDSLKGKSIPLGSRILAVSDAYAAMVHERPYREAPLSHADAVTLLQKEAGIKWDPFVVDSLAKMSPDSLL